MSRALGDYAWGTTLANVQIIYPKPKITMQRALPGDLLVLACDGLKDFVTEEQIAQCLSRLSDSDDIAQQLMQLALKTSQDNVTIVAIRIQK